MWFLELLYSPYKCNKSSPWPLGPPLLSLHWILSIFVGTTASNTWTINSRISQGSILDPLFYSLWILLIRFFKLWVAAHCQVTESTQKAVTSTGRKNRVSLNITWQRLHSRLVDFSYHQPFKHPYLVTAECQLSRHLTPSLLLLSWSKNTRAPLCVLYIRHRTRVLRT